MQRYRGVILSIGVGLLVVLALSVAGNLEVSQVDESEWVPLRSSYNAGPTGTRAFYQMLEAMGHPVARWRDRFTGLPARAAGDLLVMVGPFTQKESLTEKEQAALLAWLKQGGQALIVSRAPEIELNEREIISESVANEFDWRNPGNPPPVDEHSDRFIIQPTGLTHGLQKLSFSTLATRLRFGREPQEKDKPAKTEATDQVPPAAVTAVQEAARPALPPPPAPDPATPATQSTGAADDHEQWPFATPIIHLGDDKGALLADCRVGAGRMLFLSDPFIAANAGIARGGNLGLLLNVVNELGTNANGQPRRIWFDEYHHGYGDDSNALVTYFRGTPFWWVLAQLLALAGLLFYSLGKRFARPLPLPQTDRHSPLEFVSSLANLQQSAGARELALENIYPRFKTRLCRQLGLPARSAPADIIVALRQHPRLAAQAEAISATIQQSEDILQHRTSADDQTLVTLVAAIRQFSHQRKVR